VTLLRILNAPDVACSLLDTDPCSIHSITCGCLMRCHILGRRSRTHSLSLGDLLITTYHFHAPVWQRRPAWMEERQHEPRNAWKPSCETILHKLFVVLHLFAATKLSRPSCTRCSSRQANVGPWVCPESKQSSFHSILEWVPTAALPTADSPRKPLLCAEA